MNFKNGILQLLLVYIVLFALFFFVQQQYQLGLPIIDLFILLSSALGINILSLLFFHAGQKRSALSGMYLTLVAIGIKMSLYMVLIIIFFILSKIEGIQFAVSFFIIYLTFTACLVIQFIKLLNHNKIG
jgi:hypothetical protein